ncbi:MAG: hypothetical protein M1834_005403 [Cirrosporium novae-zelandiae]|nr:MAG: hypothetical protein M1834_005403 [Cirrosporium novae-zelandiae]
MNNSPVEDKVAAELVNSCNDSGHSTPGKVSQHDSENLTHVFVPPPGYFTSPFFLGSVAALGLSAMAGIGGFSLAASILTDINEDIGPDNGNITWVSLVYLLTQAVAQTILGRLSDLFGRRWLFISSGCLALVGSIICATAQNVPTLVGGNTLVGLASAAQVSWPYVLCELVPINWRFFSMGYIYCLVIPFTGLGPVISNAFVHQTSVGWRGIYYLMIAIDASSIILFFIFYFPPTFAMKHSTDKRSKMEVVKNFDYLGLFTFSAGLLLLLLGLSWGGVLYAWKSAAVVSTIIIGGLLLFFFAFWELKYPLKEPLVPMYLFKNTGWVTVVLLLSIGVSMYYAFYIVWPTQVGALYHKSDSYDGWLSSASSGSMLLGQISAGIFASLIGKTRYQLMVSMTCGAAFIGGVACVNAYNKATVVTLLILGNFSLGWTESLCLTLASIAIDDQADIGTAVGITSSIRSAISTVATAIFTTVLSNRLADTIAADVPVAVVEAGLPSSSVESFIAALTSGSSAALEAVEGVSSGVIAAGTAAYKEANAEAYSTVYLVTLAFSGLGVIISYWAPNVEDKMTAAVSAVIYKAETSTGATRTHGNANTEKDSSAA